MIERQTPPRQHLAARATRLLGLLAALLLPAGHGQAAELRLATWSGVWQKAQAEQINAPWTARTGIAVKTIPYDGRLAPIRQMVGAQDYEWDIVDLERAGLDRLCDEGLLEPLGDAFWAEAGGRDAFIAPARHECAMGLAAWSVVMAYRPAGGSERTPNGWADFWDTGTFPGGRALRDSPRGTLEIALLSLGTPPADIYRELATPEGLDRAFARLDELRPHITHWWIDGGEPAELLAAGTVRFASAYHGRIHEANGAAEEAQIAISWTGQLVSLDYLAIPRGTPNRDLALAWLAHAGAAETQAAFAASLGYGPVVRAAFDAVPASARARMPTAPENGYPDAAVPVNEQFWQDRLSSILPRFETWRRSQPSSAGQ